MRDAQLIPVDRFNIRYTADLVGGPLPCSGFTAATVQLAGTDATWGTGVITVKRANMATGPWHAMETTGAGIDTIGPGSGMTATLNVSGIAFIGLFITTAEGGGADEWVAGMVCLKDA